VAQEQTSACIPDTKRGHEPHPAALPDSVKVLAADPSFMSDRARLEVVRLKKSLDRRHTDSM